MEYDFTIRLSDLQIKVCTDRKQISELCGDYCIAEGEPLFSVSTTEKDVAENGKEYGFPDHYSEWLLIYREIAEKIVDYDRIVVHAAAITAPDGGCYLLMAPSGTGKTTRAVALCERYGARILNGDKPILLIGDTIKVYGTPWAGKEGWNENRSAPLKGIVFVERSEETSLSSVSSQDLFERLFAAVYRPGKLSVLVRLLGRIMEKTPFYVWKGEMSDRLIDLAEDLMR